MTTIRRDGFTDAFFDHARRGDLAVKRCAECAHWHAPEATGCHRCGSETLTWTPVAGDAVLITWAKVHPRGEGEVQHIAYVELAEGPWLHAALDGVDAPVEGLPLRAAFVRPEEGEPVLVFRPA
ncbi:OB-fold domain-containing protein [Actinocorallia sp. API 0066]|uniref:Zn-ribbon domain-containing OB-fold protein n=1 Tax=Actinocorallia sp. API 0066 TaxID=2896846 RepID=UPI001E2D0F1A|nr:OB-fold domain-containing protein [Actinocorallia sp. API 0066]MCD0450731.1 OB-fold domain-containing protein [Actinocorallia sp. API 0066]